MNKKQAIAILNTSAQKFRDNLCGKKILVAYFECNLLNYIEIKIQNVHFQHLTGVITPKLSPSMFYSSILDGRLSPSDFYFKSDGTTLLKLQVLPQLMSFQKNASMIGDANNNRVRLMTEKVLGSTSSTIGLVKSNNGIYYPNTALKSDIREETYNIHKILLILSKSIREKEYSVIEKIGKGVSADELLRSLSSEVQISEDLLN